jgi:hypothetical protein
MDELIERRKPLADRLVSTCEIGQYADRVLIANVDTGLAYRNPDGPEALDALTTLQAREATLINLLRQAQASFRYTLPKFPDVEHAIDEALATSDLAKEKGSNG